MQPRSNFIRTNDYNTHYLEAGKGEPLILIHGGGAGADGWGNWQYCMNYFAERMHVYAIDMVGFGRSDAPDPSQLSYTQDTRNQQLVAFIEAMGLREVNLIGNSMGGSTSLGAAMLRPELIKNIVLMGSAGLSKGVSEALKPVVHYDYTMDGMRKVVEVLANPDFVASDEMLRYRFELSTAPAVRRAYDATMGWIKSRGGLYYEEDEIRAVKNRTLVFNGKDDLVIPMSQAYRFLELLENSHGYFLPNCRHWAMIEHPKIFSSVSLSFLNDYR